MINDDTRRTLKNVHAKIIKGKLMLANPHQRVGAESNAKVGHAFEQVANALFANQGILLENNFKLTLGVHNNKKMHAFDLGCAEQKIIVECKSHRWTGGTNIPSAKLTVWNEAMFYFHLAPKDYRKIMFVLRDYCARRQLTLAEYYLKNFYHLIPAGVELWEFDESQNAARILSYKQI